MVSRETEAGPVARVPGHIMGWRRERGGAWPGFFPFKRRCRGRSHFPFSSSSSGGGGERGAGVWSWVSSREGTRAGRAFRRLLGRPCRRAPLSAGRPVGPRQQLPTRRCRAVPLLCPGGRRTFSPLPSPTRHRAGERPPRRSPAAPAGACRPAPTPAHVPGERRPLAACEPDFPGPAPRPRPGDRAPPRRCNPPPPLIATTPRPLPPPPPFAAQPRSGRGRGCGGQRSGAAGAAEPLPCLLCGAGGGGGRRLACLSGRGGVSPEPARQVWADELGTAGAAAVLRTGPRANRLLCAAAR